MKKTNCTRTAAVWLVCFSLVSCGGGGGGGSSAPAAKAPDTPVIAASANTNFYNGESVPFSATATDPQGRALGYMWNFGDGSAPTPGQTVSHAFANAGVYTISVTATNTANLTSSVSTSFTVLPNSPITVQPNVDHSTVVVNQSANFAAGSSYPAGLQATFNWDFGDGNKAQGSAATHAFAGPGTYHVTLTASDNAGSTATATMVENVVATMDNTLIVDCAGAYCGAESPTQYNGSGVGAWRYVNASTQNAAVDISIAGVTPGNTATLIFTDATASAATPPDVSTSQDVAPSTTPGDPAHEASKQASHIRQLLRAQETGHTRMTNDNLARAIQLRTQHTHKAGTPAHAAARAAVLATPTVGSIRSWNDTFDSTTSPVVYSATVAATCSTASGRNIVFWLDPNAQADNKVTSADITQMKNISCGTNGGFAQLNNLLGDVWGSSAASYTDLIQDASGALQDINIVIADVPVNTGWAGYFSNYNNFLTSSAPNSNQALVFFINANSVQTDVNYVLSALLHEATHMTNFYQRSVVRDDVHQTWLEETSAMMTEDIVVPGLLGGYDTDLAVRLPDYLATGGGVSYINWPQLSDPNYALGGSFGAFLNRRFGVRIYQQLITNCVDGFSANDSVTCLDDLIKVGGSGGFADEFARFGASVFAQINGTQTPSNYGFPFYTSNGYSFAAADLSSWSSATPASMSGGVSATSHVFITDQIVKDSYSRIGVQVPAGTSLTVIIR